MMIRLRWTIAAAGALALALLTLGTPPPLPDWGAFAGTAEAAEFSCPADAKPANLNFTVTDIDGKKVSLAAYKGHVIVLDFWATWCLPCKVEIPGFVDLQSRYGAQGLQVLGVSVDDSLDKLLPYAAQYKMNYPVLQGLGHDDLMDAYGPIWGLPVSVVISRDGRICASHSGLTAKETFEQQIKALL
jgi:peroxiredoxin